MKIKGVGIGDQFTKRGDKQNRVYTVSDIYTVTNFKGEVVKHICIATHGFLNQLITCEIPFSAVIRGKI